jgi:hypothetical protein
MAAWAAIDASPRVKEEAREEGQAICRALYTWVLRQSATPCWIVQQKSGRSILDHFSARMGDQKSPGTSSIPSK